MNRAVGDCQNTQRPKWDGPLRAERWSCEGRGELPQGQPVITERRTLLLGKFAGEFIRRAEGRSNDQDFFRGPPHIEPIPSVRDAVVAGSGRDGGKAH
jgi:hypothetical protein